MWRGGILRGGLGWGVVQVKNLLGEEVGRWLHPHFLEAKRERTADIVQNLKNGDSSTSSSDDSTVGDQWDVSDDVSI